MLGPTPRVFDSVRRSGMGPKNLQLLTSSQVVPLKPASDHTLRPVVVGNTEKETPVVLFWAECLCPPTTTTQNSYIGILTCNVVVLGGEPLGGD